VINNTIEEERKIEAVENRILGRISGNPEGPVFICVGGIHGNERAGIYAIQEVFDSLSNGSDDFNGEFIGLAGNLSALNTNKRYVDKDLNRLFSTERAESLFQDEAELCTEDIEQKELLRIFHSLKQNYTDKKIVMLDLHTTSASGGTFTIAMENEQSKQICSELEVTSIHGLESVLNGTTLNYFDEIGFTALGFEAGQHNDPVSIIRMKSAIYITLAAIGAYFSPELQNHKQLLKALRKDQPNRVKFIYRHQINKGDNFIMKAGYKNFQKIEKGEHLADDKSGPIYSKSDGIILMPLYQPQGDDGFFMVEAID